MTASKMGVLEHPTFKLAAYLLLPVLINANVVLCLPNIVPDWSLLMLRSSGVLIAVSWGWSGLLFCMLTGIALGLPVAACHVAFLRHRLARVQRGADVPGTLNGPVVAAITIVPWFLMATVGYLSAHFWLFPPIGGPIVAVNVLWARTLVYHQQLWVYEYEKAYGEQ